MVPSTYLHVEVTQDQVDLLNPTPRDVQIGAIIDQCIGKKAKKKIARRRIDFVTGNVNSYARILNGPAQIEKIKTYNQLSASIAQLQRDREANTEASRAQKKKVDLEKAAKKLEKEREAKELHYKLLPSCQEHVQQGLLHVLVLKLGPKRDILKHVYAHEEAKSSLRLPRANELLRLQFSAADGTNASENYNDNELQNGSGGEDGNANGMYVGEAVVDDGDVAMIPMPLLPGMALEEEDDGVEGDVDALGGSEEDKNEEGNETCMLRMEDVMMGF